jgi:putative tricarboxylic transport membrane protein
MALLGVFLSTVGADKMTSVIRVHYGLDSLFKGFELAPFFIGIFAASEIFQRVGERNLALVPKDGLGNVPKLVLPSAREYLSLKWTILRGSIIGLIVGILPGTGASSAALIAYGAEVRSSSDPSRFGKGVDEGIAAPESANNAAAVGAFIPLLSLGIPGSGTTAVLISALLVHGVQPGPMLMQTNPSIFAAIAAGATLSVAGILLCSVALAKLFARLAYVPYHFIATGIITVSVGGAFSVGGADQALIMLGFGVLGLCLRRFAYPLAPLVLGFVLGPIVEVYLRRALLMTGDELLPIVSRPMTALLLATAVALLLWPTIQNRRARAISRPA